MEQKETPLHTVANTWPSPAQTLLWACRATFHDIASTADIGPLDETLKWGQPSWRPKKPRTGSTLRLNWSPKSPDHLSFFVDCKTDLAARMQEMYPNAFQNDGQRQMIHPLTAPLPAQAIAHLADITFRYHLNKRAAAIAG